MSESERPSLPDSPGAKSAEPSTQMAAMENYTVKNVKPLPEFSFKNYLKFVAPLGHELEVKTGIHHLVPMIQSAHESRNGNSGLARSHGNLFGIVATDSWKKAGNTLALMPTWEVINGKKVDTWREFRAYPSWRDSFLDWAKLITTLNVYKKAYELLKDKATVPDGLELMGVVYATDPAYARKLRVLYEKTIQEGIL